MAHSECSANKARSRSLVAPGVHPVETRQPVQATPQPLDLPIIVAGALLVNEKVELVPLPIEERYRFMIMVSVPARSMAPTTWSTRIGSGDVGLFPAIVGLLSGLAIGRTLSF